MNTMKFSPKDAKLIREHHGKSPEDLLTVGISKKAYEKLKAANKPVDIQPVKVETVKMEGKKSESKNIVMLKNLRTGLVTRLKKSTADMLLSVYPKTYKTI